MNSVVFNVEEFKTLYPQFANVNEATDLAERKMLLYMLVCHIATLKKRGDSIVGTITSAAEGKVNVSVTPLVNANWYTQTVCGAMYWQATAKYRVGVRYFAYCRC